MNSAPASHAAKPGASAAIKRRTATPLPVTSATMTPASHIAGNCRASDRALEKISAEVWWRPSRVAIFDQSSRGQIQITASRLREISSGVAMLAIHSASARSEEHTSELQSHVNLVCRLLLEK